MTRFFRKYARPGRLGSLARSVFIGTSLLTGLAACGNMAANTGVSYNEGLAESYNSILLMNIIRSAKNYPLYYSALGDYSADHSTDFDFDPSVDVPVAVTPNLLIDGDIDLSLGPSASLSRDYNANASSLETEDFIAAINTALPPKTLLFFTEGRNRGTLSLILMLLVDRLAVTQQEHRQTLLIAKNRCTQSAHKLSIENYGICQNLTNYSPPQSCAQHSRLIHNAPFVGISNDPTNTCEFGSFKHFIEALVISDPRIVTNKDGNLNFIIDPVKSKLTLFNKDKTGIDLRSPHEAISYLGKIVRQTYLGYDLGLLTLAAPDGKSVPIFLVKDGSSSGRAAVTARVDGEGFWIPKQDLRAKHSHFSFMAMSVVKDIISLNTTDKQLPTSPTRLIVD